MKRVSRIEDLMDPEARRDTSRPGQYEAPTITVLDEAQLLEFLGPAQAYSGVLPGASGSGGL